MWQLPTCPITTLRPGGMAACRRCHMQQCCLTGCLPSLLPSHTMPGCPQTDDADAAALAQGLDSNLVLSPQQPHMMPPPMPGAPPQYYGQQRGGPSGYAGGPNAPPQYLRAPLRARIVIMEDRGQQQMGMQPHMRQPGGMGHAAGGPGHHHHQQQMGMNGHPPGFRGDMGGPGPNGHGPRSSSNNSSSNRGGRGGYGMQQVTASLSPRQQRRKRCSGAWRTT